jgi:hypothetical protein
MEQSAARQMLKVLSTLNEAQARWYVAKEALSLGRGGLKRMHELTGLSRPTILKGIRELQTKRKLSTEGGIRRQGGGRKRVDVLNPRLSSDLEKILEETTAGDPMSLLRWTGKSVAKIAEALTQQGHEVSSWTVWRRLSEMDYSLQGNVKTKEGRSPKNRDEQFQRIQSCVQKNLNRGNPVLSVDTKKKEHVGEFKNNGQTWRPKGNPRRVNAYDFPSLAIGTAIPYGAYDIRRNEGLVNVGVSHDTAEFAVQSIRQWWNLLGKPCYPDATRLLLCADGGGSNGSRNRAWKYFLQQLSDEIAIEIAVCHYPPGTSKWNKIEHRMFSFISLNWKGQPLVSYETVLNLIGSTRTKKGLQVKALLDKKKYKTGKKISDEEMEKLNIKYHYDSPNPQWNYTIYPRTNKKKSEKKTDKK